MFAQIWLWFLSVFRISLPRRFKVRTCLDMPVRNEIEPLAVHVVGPSSAPKWATFACPCGCGEALLLSLNQAKRPRWIVRKNWLGAASISPSIRRNSGCRSHFWIRNGEVRWCADTGREGVFPKPSI